MRNVHLSSAPVPAKQPALLVLDRPVEAIGLLRNGFRRMREKGEEYQENKTATAASGARRIGIGCAAHHHSFPFR